MAKVFKRHEVRLSVDDVKFYGGEPTWEDVEVTELNRKAHMAKAFNWYNYTCKEKDYRRFFEDWIRVYRADTADEDRETLGRVADRNLSSTLAAVARLDVLGFPVTELEKSQVWQSLVASAGNEETTDVAEKPQTETERIGVQERMDLQVGTVVSEIEDIVHDIIRAKRKEGKMSDVQGLGKFSAIHFKKLADALKRSTVDFYDLRAAREQKDPDDSTKQLIEGYEFISNKSLKAALQFLDDCQAGANRLAIEKKVARVRKARPVDRNKLVRKLKFLPEHKELKLTSIKPVELLGASEVWVYNVRRRKLGVFRCEFSNSIMVKGSKVIGTAESSCVQKTLRKPETQLAEFMKLNKNQLRKWFDGIKGVETKLKARTTEDTVLLRTT